MPARPPSAETVPPPSPDGIDPDWESVRFVVPLECTGLRLDRFLTTRIRWVSRSRARRIVVGGATDARGRRLRPSHRVAASEVVWVFRQKQPEPPPPDAEIGILHEDDDLVVLDKPAGIAAHPTSRYREATITRFLQMRYPGTVPRLGHRIDRETSGVVLATRTYDADRALKALFERRSVEKTYLALVHGRPEPLAGVIRLPLGLSATSRIHIKMEARPDGLPAETRYRTLLEAGDYSLVAAEPRTGRQHQIRAHLAALGCPLVGDKIYHPEEDTFLDWLAGGGVFTEALRAKLVLDRQALHAWTVALPHPTLGDRRRFFAPIPADLADLLERCAGPRWRESLPKLGRDEPAEWP